MKRTLAVKAANRAIGANGTLATEEHAGAGGELHDVYFRLRTAILDGAIPPGEILNQVHIARSLNVSRTPVREAMRMLQAEGLVEAQFQHRMRVTPVTAEEVDGAYGMWILMQGLAVALTVSAITGDELAQIRATFEAMSKQSPQRGGSEARWAPLHRTFHAQLIMHAGPVITAAIDNCWSRSERARRTFMRPGTQSWVESEREHRELVRAYAARSVDQAVEVAIRQLRRIALDVIAGIDTDFRPRTIEAAMALARGTSGRPVAPPPRTTRRNGQAVIAGRSGSPARNRG